MEYAPNLEYHYIGETKCGNTVMNRHADALVKCRSPKMLAQVSFVRYWW
jgi:hypothetical protein